MARGWVHTIYRDGQWINEIEGQGALRGGKFARKTEAVEAARKRAKRDKTEHVIHTREGKIGSRNSYGSDPRRKKG